MRPRRAHRGRMVPSSASLAIRRESVDHLVVFDEADLRRVLRNYASYYNQVRTHLSLDKNAPDFRRPQKLGPSQPSQFWVGCITNMSGFWFSLSITSVLDCRERRWWYPRRARTPV